MSVLADRYTMRQGSIMTGNHGAPAPSSTEPQKADVDESRHPVEVYLGDQPPDMRAHHVPQHGIPVSWGPRYGPPVPWSAQYGFHNPWNGFLYPETTGMVPGSSPAGLQTREASSYDPVSSAADNKKNPSHSMPVQKDNDNLQDGMSPEHYGARFDAAMARPNVRPPDADVHHVPQHAYPTNQSGEPNSFVYPERTSTPSRPPAVRMQENVSKHNSAHGALGNKKDLVFGPPASRSQDSMFSRGPSTLDNARPAKMHPDAHPHPDKYARPAPQHENPTAALVGGQNNVARSKSASPDSSNGALTLGESSSNRFTNGEGRNPAAPVSEGTEKVRDNASFQNHPAGNAKIEFIGKKLKNVILFGETGVGKSSVLNLMAGSEIAQTSGHLQGCTLQSTEYWFAHSEEISLRIFDTVGLEEPEMGINSFMGAIEKAHKLVKALHDSGGVDLLLFCIKGGRITTAMQRSYRLFYEVLCGSQVPLAIVVTNLEHEDVMEDWWVKNETVLQEYGIHSVAHACITAVPAQVKPYAQKRVESQTALRNMLHDAVAKSSPTYVRDVKSWFAAVTQPLRSLVTKETLQKKKLIKTLETRCSLSRDDAQKLAQTLVLR